MTQRPRPLRSLQQPFDRRDFLKSFSAAAALALAGCGDSGGDFVFTSGTGGGGGGGGATGQVVQGTVNLVDLGAQPVAIITAQQPNAVVGSGGGFSTKVAGSNPQVLFAVTAPGVSAPGQVGQIQSPEQIRGLALHLSQDLRIDAQSTAETIIFLSFGVLTPDLETAKRRVASARNQAGFPALVDLVRAGLQQGSLAFVLSDPRLPALRDSIVDAVIAGERLLARKLSDDEFQAQGGVSVEKTTDGVPAGDRAAKFENFGFRFVSVAREELDSGGNQTRPPVLAELTGAARFPLPPLPGSRAIMGGANGASWGTLITGQVGEPGGAQETFTPHPNTVKVRYWVRGMGGGGLGANVPQNVQNLEFGITEFFNTTFFYYFLPLMDAFTGGTAGLALYKFKTVGELIEIPPQLIKLRTLFVSFLSDEGTINQFRGIISGMSGNPLELKALESIAIDLLAGMAAFMLTTGQVLVADAIASAAAFALGETGVAAAALVATLAPPIATFLGVVAAGLAVVGGGIALYSLERAVFSVAGIPQFAPIDVRVGSTLELLGTTEEIQVLDINASGAMVYNKASKLYLLDSAGSETELLAVSGEAFINKEGDVLFQRLDRQDHAKLRYAADGVIENLPVPDEAQSQFATGLIGLTPQRDLNGQTGTVPFAVAVRDDGRPDIYSRTGTGLSFNFLGAPEGGMTASFFSAGVGENVVAFNTDGEPDIVGPFGPLGGRPQPTTARYIIGTGQWRHEIHSPGDVPFGYGYVDINNKNEILARVTSSQTNVGQKPPNVTLDVWIQNGDWIQFSTSQESEVVGSSGTRSVETTFDLIEPRGNSQFHTVTSLNDEGQVVGTMTRDRNVGSFPALWSNGNNPEPTDITSLFPPGSPTDGGWTPKLIRGGRILLERATADAVEVYLFNLD